MAENENVPGGPAEEPATDSARDGEPAAPAPVLVTRWRDRAWSFRAMIAVALASLVVGGLAGGAVMAVSDDDSDRDHYRMGPWGPGGKLPPGWRERGPRWYDDGGPHWRWDDDAPRWPDDVPSPPTPPPSTGSTG